MPTPTAFEQEMLELVNRARSNPGGEVDVLIADAASQTGTAANITSPLRFFGVDVDAFVTQMQAYTAVAPLAWNLALSTAAQDHSALMIAEDEQSHRLPGEPLLRDRITDAGYTGWSNISENIFAYTQDPLQGHAGFMIDWGYDAEDFDSNNVRYSDWQSRGDGIQDPPGHRDTILSGRLTEIGIAAVIDSDPGTDVGPYVVTQNFGNRSAYTPQLLGVVLEDGDSDRFYDAGEGLGGIAVTVKNGSTTVASTTTWDSGGYQVALAPGSYTVTFSGTGLAGIIEHQIAMGTENLKLDGFAADAMAGPTEGPDNLTGNNSNNRIEGLGGNDTLTGLGGDDTLLGGLGDDWLTPGSGRDTVDGGAGADMVNYLGAGTGAEINLFGRFARVGSDTDTLIGIENATGTIFGDFIRGDGNDNRLRGLGDYDWIVGSDGADFIDGGTGRDMISYVYATGGVTVDLGAGRGRAGQAAGDRYESIERVTGSIYSDLTYGSAGEDDFRGLGGYDWFVGSTGGKDRYDGGSGKDTVAYSASAAGVAASLLLGRGTGGDAARDLYTDIENLTGSSFADMLTGDNGRNVLRGLYGDDTILGNGGVDYITGGGGDDHLDGGSGWDVAVFAGNRDEYSVSAGAGGATIVTFADGSYGEGTDTLYNFEALQFADDLVFL